MESFKHRDKEIKFWSITGEVIGQNKYSETHVSSSGGGGYVGQQGGYVSAPQVKSKVTTQHEFWVRKEDGTEESIKFTDVDIPLREGQKITLIASYLNYKERGPWSILVNHSEKKHRFIKSAVNLNELFHIDVFLGISLAYASGIFFLLSFLLSFVFALGEYGIAISFAAAILYLIIHVSKKLPRITKMTKSLSEHLEALAQQAYKNVI